MAIANTNETYRSFGEKSPAAFRTIAEVAVDLDLPQHVLRFWESRFPQIKPLKRRGGRRYYRPEDIALLRTIRSLLHEQGYTIRGVQRLLREGAARDVIEKAPAAEAPGPTRPVPKPARPAAKLTNELRNLLEQLENARALLRGVER